MGISDSAWFPKREGLELTGRAVGSAVSWSIPECLLGGTDSHLGPERGSCLFRKHSQMPWRHRAWVAASYPFPVSWQRQTDQHRVGTRELRGERLPGGQRGASRSATLLPRPAGCTGGSAQSVLASCHQRDLDPQEHYRRSGRGLRGLSPCPVCNLGRLRLFWVEGKGWEGQEGEGEDH